MQNPGEFKKEVSDTLLRYPKLTLLCNSKGLPCLKGIIDIDYNNGENAISFDVLIEFPLNYPFWYPSVWEVGGMFPKEQDFHYLDNDALCLDAKQNIFLKSRNGINVSDFIEGVVIPNLAWRYCLLEKIPFEKKEYQHGIEGTIEAYKEILNTDDDRFVMICLYTIVYERLPDRNSRPCICGKNEKYKKCHEALIQNVLTVPMSILQKDTTQIYQFLKAKSRI